MGLRVDGPNKTWICIKHTNTHNHSLLPEKYIKLLGANRSIPPEIEEIVRELCRYTSQHMLYARSAVGQVRTVAGSRHMACIRPTRKEGAERC